MLATQGDPLSFDRVERGRHVHAPSCRACGRVIAEGGLQPGDLVFCPACATESRRRLRLQEGKIGYLLLWLLGIPIPILLLIYVLRGCN
jgi:hypothetical protein